MPAGLIQAVVACAGWVPEGFLRALFTLAADLVWFFHLGSVSQLERNLRHVVGPISHSRMRQLSREATRSYFAYFCEALSVGARDNEELVARVRASGTGFPDPGRTLIGQQSMPVAMGHQGNWDYAGLWAGYDLAPVTTVAERLDNPKLLNIFVEIRRKLGMQILLTGQPGLTRQLTEVLAEPNHMVPLLADRDLSRNGVFVRAFDSMIRVAAGPAVIALDSKLPLYTVNVHREIISGERRRRAKTKHGYVCQVDGPIAIEPYLNMPRAQAVQALSQAWVDQWSLSIKQWPQDWHMMQPIFIEDLDLTRLHNVPDNLQEMMNQRQQADPVKREDK